MSQVRLDPRRVERAGRIELLDSEYRRLVASAASNEAMVFTGGEETAALWYATCDTFIEGIWVATIVCAHATCERTLASLIPLFYAVPPEPKGWLRWGLGGLIAHMRDAELLEPTLLDEIQFVCDARKPLVHWRPPLHADSLSRIGAEAYVREEDGLEAQDQHVAQLAFLCARTALRVHFGNLFFNIGRH